MLKKIEKYKIILGSGSPRRRELLAGLGLKFEVVSIDTDESYPENLIAEEIPVFLAQKKAAAHILEDNTLLITADTIVWLDGKVFGKPKDRDDAVHILQCLSGKTHQVISGVCVKTLHETRTFSVVSDVTFATLTNEVIAFYVDNFQPFDKAGAYGIQEWIGYIGVEKIAGSFYNIMGLPVQRLYKVLSEIENF